MSGTGENSLRWAGSDGLTCLVADGKSGHRAGARMPVNPRADPLKTLEDKTLFLEKEIRRLERKITGLEKKFVAELDKLREQSEAQDDSLSRQTGYWEQCNREIEDLNQELASQNEQKADRDHKHSAR